MVNIGLGNAFNSFCKTLQLTNRDEMVTTAGGIAKKLNKYYYEIENDASSHMYIVGSVGRNTATNGISDLDLLFDLPIDVYRRFDAYTDNGQSALLQDVKNCLLERYPNTDIKGDGQVVVIDFDKYRVELVPGFKNDDDSFKYPDTHDGGSWKTTNPIPEQKECNKCNADSNGVFFDFCHIIRSWKNTVGAPMGGLLIDTLVYNHFGENGNYKGCQYEDYLGILKNIFKYLKSQNKDQAFWYAVGSNQRVYNKNEGAFVYNAEEAFGKLDGVDESTDEIYDTLTNLLGIDFPNNKQRHDAQGIYESAMNSDKYSHIRGTSTEQFIEELFQVDIRHSLYIDCNVTQGGSDSISLRKIIREHRWLSFKKDLDFHIINTSCHKPYDIYWKVRNVGEIAQRRNMIRGEIYCTNKTHQYEHTSFSGPHYVECFLVRNNICIARARIDVPIKG